MKNKSSKNFSWYNFLKINKDVKRFFVNIAYSGTDIAQSVFDKEFSVEELYDVNKEILDLLKELEEIKGYDLVFNVKVLD